MQQISSLVLCLLVAFASGAPLDGSKGDCPDGSANGAQIERGRFIYECRDGKIVAKGCVTLDLQRIDVGSTADMKHYRVKCSLVGDELTLEAVACLHKGSEHKVDEIFEDGTNFFNCKRVGSDLKVVNLGCLDGGKRVNLNEKVVKDDLVMLCNETVNNGARLMPSGCVKDGKQYNVGDSFENGKFWFNCTRTGREKVAMKAAGCVANGKHLNDGDRFQDNDVMYECRIDSGKNDIVATACIQHDHNGGIVERKLGCHWAEGQAPFEYEWECKYDSATNTAVKIQTRCNYKVGGGVYNIEPGCYRMVEKAAFGCLKDGQNLKLQSFQGDNAEQAASGAGLHAC
jgi:hypothetical protein